MTRLINLLWASSIFLLWATCICFLMAVFVKVRPAQEFFPVLCVALGAVGIPALLMKWNRRRSIRNSAGVDDQVQIEALLNGLDRMEQRVENLETILTASRARPSLNEEFERLRSEQ